jgi:hypothetical protein
MLAGQTDCAGRGLPQRRAYVGVCWRLCWRVKSTAAQGIWAYVGYVGGSNGNLKKGVLCISVNSRDKKMGKVEKTANIANIRKKKIYIPYYYWVLGLSTMLAIDRQHNANVGGDTSFSWL